jgi:hypothetical protein
MNQHPISGRLMASVSRPIALAVPAFLMWMGVAAAQQATPTAQKVATNDTGAPSSQSQCRECRSPLPLSPVNSSRPTFGI